MQKFGNIIIAFVVVSIGFLSGCTEQFSTTQNENIKLSFWSYYDLAMEIIEEARNYFDFFWQEKNIGSDMVGKNNYEAAVHLNSGGQFALDSSVALGKAKSNLEISGYKNENNTIKDYVSLVINDLDRIEHWLMHMGLALQYIADATKGLNSVALKVFGTGDASASEVVDPASQAQYHITLGTKEIEIEYLSDIKSKEKDIEKNNPQIFEQHQKFSEIWYKDVVESSKKKIYFNEIGWAKNFNTELSDWEKVESGEIPPTEIILDTEIDINNSVKNIKMYINYHLENRDFNGIDIRDIIVEINGFEVAHSNKLWYEGDIELDLSAGIPILIYNNDFRVIFQFQDSYGLIIYPDSYIEFY